jgi:hypothetical protein
MDNKIIKYDEVKETYFSFIRETLLIVKKIIENKKSPPYHLNDKNFFISKAQHIQAMSFIGLVGEHLIKIILLKRGYVINEIISIRQSIRKNKNELIIGNCT